MSRILSPSTYIRGISAFTALLMAFLLLPLPMAASTAPDDTPTPVVSDNVEEWTVGQGLLYWANNCFGDEFNPFAALKRKPAGGGSERTLEAINDYGRCATYRNLLSSADGLYYFDESEDRIERMPLAPPFTPEEVKTLAPNEAPTSARALVEGGGYLYWTQFLSRKILRTLKDGTGGIETVADTASSPADVIVVGATVYWTDSAGVWTISTGCGALPCTGTISQFASFGANTSGYGLLYIPLGGVFGNFNVFWVQRTASGSNSIYRIQYRSCNQITVCTLVPPSTFHTATTDWLIGSPVFAGGNLYWNERDVSTVNNGTGDVKRKARTNPAGGADTIATNQARIDPRLFVSNDLLFFARANTGIYSLALNASALLRDLTAEALEVTQAIQNLANGAPLAAEKATYVRAYGRQLSGPNTPNVEARLEGTKNGLALPGSPLQPVNGVRSLATGGGYNRARLDDGWYFLLPASWTKAGALTLKFAVDPRQMHSDPNRADNELGKTVSFQAQPPVCVWTVPVRTHTPLPSTTDPNFWGMVSHFDRRWPAPKTWIFRDTEPVEELQVCWAGIFPYPCFGPYELEDGWSITNGPPDRDKVITSLWTRALLSFNPDSCDDVDAPVHFMGMVHPDANNGGASGYASTISNQSWVQLPAHTPNPIPAGFNSVRPGRVMAQELAHNYGRKHVDCGNPEDIDNNYPYPPCQISDVGPDKYYGFDTVTLTPIRPDGASDFMTYDATQWVSDYTWRALINSVAAATAPSLASIAAGESVFVNGMIDIGGNRGEIATVLVMPEASLPPATRTNQAAQLAGASMPAQPAVVYRLRLYDAIGTIVAARTLTVLELDDHDPGSGSALFSDVFPAPAAQVSKIELLADATVLDTILVGPHMPTLAIQSPAAGVVIEDDLDIAWTAADADGDSLSFTIQYSHDNSARWHTLVSDHPNEPDGYHRLSFADVGDLQGSAPNAALIRVLASDGYNTTIAASPGFTLANRKPTPFIVAPVAGQTFAAGKTILLSGGATDAEDGGLSEDSFAWTVDGQASGAGAETMAAGLSTGSHSITLQAVDSAGNEATATVEFIVAPLSIPVAAAALLDGVCSDGVYAGATQLQLQPYGDGSQATVQIARSNDHLWACFTGLKPGASTQGAFAGLRLDVNDSRDGLAQATDFGFLAGEDGSVFTYAGDGSGGFTSPGPGGLQAQVSAGTASWSAELRIDKDKLGGWDHLVGLQAVHGGLRFEGDDYLWPYASAWNKPITWAEAALGSQPLITALDPSTTTVNGAAFILSVEGSGFVEGVSVRWDDSVLPTTVIDSEHITATVAASYLELAGEVAVSVHVAVPGNLGSNQLPFLVEPLSPLIVDLSPESVRAGSPATSLTIYGANFAADTQALWNGVPLLTQFINPTQVKVTLPATLLTSAQSVGVTVRNQLPFVRISNSKPFDILPPNHSVFLPVTQRP